MDLDAAARRVQHAWNCAAEGSVINVLANGSVVIEGPTQIRPDGKSHEQIAAAFVVVAFRRCPSQLTIRELIKEGLRKLEA